MWGGVMGDRAGVCVADFVGRVVLLYTHLTLPLVGACDITGLLHCLLFGYNAVN